MKDERKAKEQLIKELVELRQRVIELEAATPSRETEIKYRNIFETAPNGIVTLDIKGTITSCNPAFKKLTGFAEKDIVGKHFTKIPTLRAKDLAQYVKMFTAILRSQVPDPIEFDWLHRDGTLRRGEAYASLIKVGSKVVGLQAILIDITEREVAETRLRESEERFAKAFHASPNLMTITRMTDGYIVDVNQSFASITGYSREELVGDGTVELGLWAEPEARERFVKMIQEQGQVDNFEMLMYTKSGENLSVLLSGETVQLNDQAHLITVANDITERKQAQQELERRTAQLEALRQVGLELVIQLDLETLLNTITARAVELLGGVSGSLYLYRPDRDVLESVVEIGPLEITVGTTLQRGESSAGKVLETGKPMIVEDYPNWEGRSETFAGQPLTALVDVPIRWADEILGVLCVDGDAVGAFSQADAELLELFASQAAIAIHNSSLFEQAQQEIAERKQMEIQLQEHTLHLEQLVAEKVHELEQERAKVIHTSKLASLGQMASGVAHELNQPLTALLFEGEYLKRITHPPKDGPVDPPLDLQILHQVGEDIISDVGRCARIINHLRTFSRISERTPSEIDLNQPIEDSFVLVNQRLREHAVAIHLDLAPDLPLILADGHRLEQVFLNLITNAEYGMAEMARRVEEWGQGDTDTRGKREKTPAGYQKVLEIRTTVQEDWVVATVYDNGIGIPQADQEHIFEPFFTTKPVGEGTGLGLSISYGIVKDFGGEISFESAENEGTTFTLRFPAISG